MNVAKGVPFSISKLIFVLIAILVLIIGSLWIRGDDLPGVSSGLYLDEAHVHGAVSSVGAQVDGRISALHVELGDTVETGDLLITLENDALEAQVDAAERVVKQRRLELNRAKVADRLAKEQAEAALIQALSEVDAAEARLNAARAQQDLRQSELERIEELAADGVASRSTLETATEAANAARELTKRREAELDVDRAQVASARTRLEREALRAMDINILSQHIAEAEADLEYLRERVNATRLRALDNGVVVGLPSRLGDSVASGDAKVEIWRSEQIWIRAWISEDDVSRIDRGDSAKISVSAIGDEMLDGTVNRILVSSEGDEVTRSGQPISPLLPDDYRFAVQLLVNADDLVRHKLLPGMSAEVLIVPSG